ncbi:rodlin [Streptomyces sp. NPDC057557]|uniref:rodlin n=1 Tax=Streptomyces sp. NPDC057557 TaxID=3346167 RepID=UPI00367DB49F
MIKRIMASAAVAASIVGVCAAIAPQAMAVGNDGGTTSFNGNDAVQSYGHSATDGDWSPQFALTQGSLDKPCIALPAKANAGSVLGAVPVSVQDVDVLASPQNRQCTENSTQAKGDEALSHILSGIPVLSGNGTGNSWNRETPVARR